MENIFNYNLAISNISEYLDNGEKGILNLISSNFNNSNLKLNINGFILNPYMKEWYVNNFILDNEINYLRTNELSDDEESIDLDLNLEYFKKELELNQEESSDESDNNLGGFNWDDNSEWNNDDLAWNSDDSTLNNDNDSTSNNDSMNNTNLSWDEIKYSRSELKSIISNLEYKKKWREDKIKFNFHINLFKNQYNNYIIHLFNKEYALIEDFIKLACEFNNITIFKYLIQRVNNNFITFGYSYIFRKNNIEILKYIIDNNYHNKFCEISQSEFFSLLDGKIDNRKFEIVRYILGTNLCKTQFLIYDAVKTRNLKLIKLVYEHGPKINRDKIKFKDNIDYIDIKNDSYMLEYYSIDDSYQDHPVHQPWYPLCELASGDKKCIEYLNSIGFY